MWIPNEDWEKIVKYVPIVSVDLVIIESEQILLGKRLNEPAKGEWFVPGGRIIKGETREEAVHRIAKKELGTKVTIKRFLGGYEHIYETADVDGACGKHYLANGYVVKPKSIIKNFDDQHESFKWFNYEQVPHIHEYVEKYIEDFKKSKKKNRMPE